MFPHTSGTLLVLLLNDRLRLVDWIELKCSFVDLREVRLPDQGSSLLQIEFTDAGERLTASVAIHDHGLSVRDVIRRPDDSLLPQWLRDLGKTRREEQPDGLTPD